MSLKANNIEKLEDATYIIAISKKTNTYTRIKIPDYVIEILKKYGRRKKFLLPTTSLNNFHNKLKELGEIAGWTYEIGKVRSKREVKKELKRTDGKINRFCDLLSSHVMRSLEMFRPKTHHLFLETSPKTPIFV